MLVKCLKNIIEWCVNKTSHWPEVINGLMLPIKRNIDSSIDFLLSWFVSFKSYLQINIMICDVVLSYVLTVILFLFHRKSNKLKNFELGAI